MAHISADRVRDTSTSTGTGAFVVSGTAPSAFMTFSAVCSTNDTFYYAIQHQTASQWEVGLGTYSSSNTITRTTVFASSNSGSAVSFSAGSKDVFITLAAARTVQLNASGIVELPASSTVGGVAVVTTTGAQTLTNKTLASPVISSISNTGTLTLPTSTDTLVGRATTDTLTNKTLTNPTINGMTGDTSVVNIGSGQFYKSTGGDIGVGTGSPSSYGTNIRTLDIEGSAGAGVKIGTGTAKYGLYYDGAAGNAYVQTFDTSPILFAPNNVERGRFDSSGNFYFNSGYGSSVVAYGCRAWVNFNGQGTVAIRKSGNVSSITDNGVGRYRINFATSLVDGDYAIAGASRETVTNGICIIVDVGDSGTRNTSGFEIQTIGSSSFILYDSAYNNVSVFR